MVKWLTDPRRARPAYAGLVAILLLLAARTLWRRLSHAPAGIDFLPLWTAAGFALDRPDRLYDFAYVTQAQRWLLNPSLGAFRPFVYPPTMLLVVLPFSLLPFTAANLVWTGLTGAGAAGASAATAPRAPWLAALLFILAPPVVLVALAGQTTLLVCTLISLGVFLLERRPWLAGLLIGVAASLKPSSMLLAPFCLVAARNWRALGGAAIGGGVSGLAAMAVFGIQPWFDWLAALPRFEHAELTLPGLKQIMVTPMAAALSAGLTTGQATIVRTVFAAAAFALALTVFYRSKDWAPRLVVLLGGGLMCSAYAMAYDVALLGPAIIAMGLAPRRAWWLGLAVYLLWAAITETPFQAYALVVLVGLVGALALVSPGPSAALPDERRGIRPPPWRPAPAAARRR